jgi:hypothetical protein
MNAKDLKVGALYEPYVPNRRFFVKGKYLRTLHASSKHLRPDSHRFLIYLGEADPSETSHNLPHYFWVFVGNEKCLMHWDKLRAIKPMEET